MIDEKFCSYLKLSKGYNDSMSLLRWYQHWGLIRAINVYQGALIGLMCLDLLIRETTPEKESFEYPLGSKYELTNPSKNKDTIEEIAVASHRMLLVLSSKNT